MPSVRLLAVGAVLGLTLGAGCAGSHAGSPTPEILRGLPPRTDPPFDLADEDDLGRARAVYDTLALDDSGRSARRRELAAAYAAQVRAQAATPALAFPRFRTALGLWDARELADPAKAPPDLELLAPVAEELFHRSSTSGAELDAVTALAVMRAAKPERAAELDKTWKDIETYTNDLAVAESGPGAERSRSIIALEAATAVFPSRWAGDQLVALYLARQEGISKAIAKGDKSDVIRTHRDPGVIRPVWNMIRVFARMRRLGEAPPVVEKLAGQFGDEAELRKRLAAAIGGGDGKSWIALMAAYMPSEGREEDDAAAGLAVAQLVCEEGAARLPKAVEPHKCVAELARISNRVPLAIRWARETRAIAPDDRDAAEIQARLAVAQLADLLGAERLQAAARVVEETEKFYADVTRIFPGKPLETTFADVLLVYGRGLYTQGEVAGGIRALERSRALDDSPAVKEELATVALKTGQFRDAQRGFEGAAASPRATPIETTFDGNRLRRLAGDAAALAGDKRRAETLWTQALASWTESLGASLPPRARVQAYSEMARLFYALGQTDKAMQAMNAAVDTVPDRPEETGVYGDVIAFLATRGHYPEALDAYHRAVGRPEVSEYLKVYTSLWMTDLARVRGMTPDASATELLGNVAKGSKWYHELARFKLGQITFEELVKRADTRGKRAEAYFYEAMARYAAGQRPRAERLLADVLSTQMLGFFEYDMANYYLRNGPPVAPLARKK